MADTSEPVLQPGRRRWRQVLVWVTSILFLLFATAFTIISIYFHRAGPILRARVVETLSTRFDSRVELASFKVSVFRGFEVNGGGLKLYPNHISTKEPCFSVDKFSFRTGWRDLFRTPMHVGRVHISGLVINLPPKEERGNLPKLINRVSFQTGSRDLMPTPMQMGGLQLLCAGLNLPTVNKPGQGSGRIEILVDELLIDQATLIIGTSRPGRLPLVFDITQLRMNSVGANQAMQFHAILINPKPVGKINSSGYFGPYNTASPGDTPVRGTYSFTDADLGTLKGIAGILSSKGSYEGVLNNIVVDGETDTPDFRLDMTGRPVPLHTKFHAIVDGTNGDTRLQPVDAQLAHSHILAVGEVVRATDVPGHNITLDVKIDSGRIEDMLKLAVKTAPPLMTGALTMHTKLHLPAGKESVIEKLRLDGNFQITGAHFTSDKVAAKIDELSLEGQGRPKEVKEGVRPNVTSEMQGGFILAGSRITLSGLKFTVPGVQVAMDGVYTLDGEQFDFRGVARLDARVSQMVTGWKSLALSVADPLFSKHGAGTELPITVTGTRSDPQIGVDLPGGFKFKHAIEEGHSSSHKPPAANPQ
jgi:hypothetical protein